MPEVATPSEEDLFNKRRAEAKCGYELKAILQPGFPVGRFRESMTVFTNIEGNAHTTISFDGARVGPVEFFGTPGTFWSPSEALARLGRVSVKEGKKFRLIMFINKAEQSFEVHEARIDPPVLKFQIVKDTKFDKPASERFDLQLDVPAGSERLTVTEPNFGTIELRTNHPDASIIRLRFELVTY